MNFASIQATCVCAKSISLPPRSNSTPPSITDIAACGQSAADTIAAMAKAVCLILDDIEQAGATPEIRDWLLCQQAPAHSLLRLLEAQAEILGDTLEAFGSAESATDRLAVFEGDASRQRFPRSPFNLFGSFAAADGSFFHKGVAHGRSETAR